MKRIVMIIAGASLACGSTLIACSSADDTVLPTQVDGGDASKPDVQNDTTQPDVNQPDASDAAVPCPMSWTDIPDAGDPSMWPDAGPSAVLMHAGASGTQDYQCEQTTTDGGPNAYAWVFIGPEADLSDCHKAKIGQHFATDAGPTRPEWITTSDNSYVVGKKVNAFTPDASSIPWLLLASVANGGTGDLSKAQHIQRLYTSNGNAPATGCDMNNVGAIQKVPYTADYYFYQQ